MPNKKTSLPNILPGIAKALQNARQKIGTHQVYFYMRKLDCWWEIDEILDVTPQTVTIRSICYMNGIKSLAVDTIHLAEIVIVRVTTPMDDGAVEKLNNLYSTGNT